MDIFDFRNQPAAWTPTIIALTIASLGAYLEGWAEFDKLTDNVRAVFDSEGDVFDFVIVGGGSAGGVVAHRLAESGQHKVLLLEGGGNINPMQSMPAMSLLMLNYPSIDWNHKTVPQKHSCYALPNNESHWSQGKGLGGTSNLNFLIQSRGNPLDFDNWANITGDKSWSYENLLPYFKKSENYHGRWKSPITHGDGGPLTLKTPLYTGMADVYVRAANELGYPRQDLNGYYTEGFDTIFMPLSRGARHGVFAGFIATASSSLTIRRFAYVTKILIHENKRAYGVEYDHHGFPKKAYAKKEVILSAGAMNSPKILMLSGIGPKEVLEPIGISVISDLPVGKNLQDHVSTYLGPFFINNPKLTFDIERDVNVATVTEFFARGTGVLTTSGTNAMGFFVSKEARKRGQDKWPDIQIIFAGVALNKRFGEELTRGFGLNPAYMEPYLQHADGRPSFLQIVSVGRPDARGTITLYNDDPYTQARIDPNYLDNQHDINVLVEGMKKAVDLVENTTAFRGLDGQFTNVSFPGCEAYKFKSDKYWECYARHVSVTLHHIVGSCTLGRSDSKDAVVDTQLRVIGVKRLRVIDASVMPVVVAGNTNAPTIMIGEKGADMILKQWTQPTLPPKVIVVYDTPTPAPTTPSTTTEDDEDVEGEDEEPEDPDNRFFDSVKRFGKGISSFFL